MIVWYYMKPYVLLICSIKLFLHFMYNFKLSMKVTKTAASVETRWHTQPRTHAPQWCFLYLRETKSWWCEGREGEEGEGEKVSMLTHGTARGMGKKYCRLSHFSVEGEGGGPANIFGLHICKLKN